MGHPKDDGAPEVGGKKAFGRLDKKRRPQKVNRGSTRFLPAALLVRPLNKVPGQHLQPLGP